jgi:23S rRNA (cytosine1962-C5)-methyltransferase
VKAPIDFPRLEGVAPAGERNLTLRVDRSAERALRKGHPWLFAEGIRDQSHEGGSGDFAVIFDRRRNFLALGLYDPESPIRVRILHSGKPTPVDAAFFARRVETLANLRVRLFGVDAETNAYRLINGENEGMPGLVADRYADVLVVKVYTAAWLPHLRHVLAPLVRTSGAAHVVLRWSRGAAAAGERVDLPDGALLYGPELAGPVLFRENGLRFECDPRRGQKTGFFLDQRDNRARVEGLAKGKDVLNVFSYTGGFSLYAARGGARSVISLDVSRPALQAAERNFEHNRAIPGVAGVRHETMAADAFRSLVELAAAGRSFDLVIVDPPSFANRQDAAGRALVAYATLVRLALGVLRPGGELVFASCSSRVTAADFFACVERAAREVRRPLRDIERTAHAADHPIGFPEGGYLKCVFARTA